jgi:hypothetical protein
MYLYLGFGVLKLVAILRWSWGFVCVFDGVFVVLVDCTGSRMTMRW